MPKGYQPAIRTRAQSYLLQHFRTVTGIGEHLLPRQGNLDGPFKDTGGQGREYRIGMDDQFGTETTTNITANHTHSLDRDAERGGKTCTEVRESLCRGVDRYIVPLPDCQGSMRFHGIVMLVGRTVAHVDPHLCLRECRLEITNRAVRLEACIGPLGRIGRGKVLFETEVAGSLLVTDLDEGRRGTCCLEGFGDHQPDGLIVVMHVIATEHGSRTGENLAYGRRDGRAEFRLARRIQVRHHVKDAWRSFGEFRVDFQNASFGNGRTENIAISRKRALRNFVGIGSGAGDLARPIDAVDRFAYELVAAACRTSLRIFRHCFHQFFRVKPVRPRRRACSAPSAWPSVS